ncbi:MAG: hypothetical protein K6C33_01250 [Desulfovibrio sp.]|nr:hypothetical protein [Desulfovibrio sp.]
MSVAFMLSPLWMLLTAGVAKEIRSLEIAVEAAVICRQALSKRKACQAGSAHGVSRKSYLLSGCCGMRPQDARQQGASWRILGAVISHQIVERRRDACGMAGAFCVLREKTG